MIRRLSIILTRTDRFDQQHVYARTIKLRLKKKKKKKKSVLIIFHISGN